MSDSKVEEWAHVLSEDYEVHAKRIQTVIQDLLRKFSEVSREAQQEWGSELAPLVMLDAMFTLMVDYGRCKLDLDSDDMEALGALLQIMAGKYPSIVKSKEQWAALTPFFSLHKARVHLSRTVN